MPLRKPASSAFIVLQGGRGSKPEGPQPTDSAMNVRRMRKPIGCVLEQNREQMFVRFRANTLPRSIAATFQTSEREVVQIINQQIDRVLGRVKVAA